MTYDWFYWTFLSQIYSEILKFLKQLNITNYFKIVLLQFMQVAYGIATSTEVAYFTYIYAKVFDLLLLREAAKKSSSLNGRAIKA